METPAARDDLPTRSPESDDAPTRAEGGVVETFGPGRQVGRFILLREVGRGGMGSVFAAYDDTLDRQVALKVVRPAPYATDGHARLVREARALARLAHPNVVAVYDVGEFAGHVFIAMELIAGETLRAWLRARPRPWREVVEVFVQACRGLAAAHRAGIVHRDFKPKQSRLPPKASPSAKRRGSPPIGAFEREAVCPRVVRSGQDGPKLAKN